VVARFGGWTLSHAVAQADAVKLLHTAIDQGINFFDTADVYGDGRSERLIAEVLEKRTETIYVATKAGRRLQPHTAEGYNESNLTAFVERSLTNLKRETLDLVQLHCPPTDVYFQPETFAALDNLKKAGKILHYGVSVARVEEAIKATEFPGVASVQIIFNLFRQRPKEHFFPLARQRDVGILVRLPLASGLLGGKITNRFGRLCLNAGNWCIVPKSVGLRCDQNGSSATVIMQTAALRSRVEKQLTDVRRSPRDLSQRSGE
jgi:aryl-alcohol dehydrogenase-like predicted oxidoreductase